jgi:Protein of unknown function (DUF4238)
MWSVNYPNTKNAHIVPRFYLQGWAVNGKIGVEQVIERKRLELAVENVGTRSRFYRRERPGGVDINDIEWTLGEIESAAAPVLRGLDGLWPLDREAKLRLAVLFAFQHLRTPRWKEEYENRTRGFVQEFDRNNPSLFSAGGA